MMGLFLGILFICIGIVLGDGIDYKANGNANRENQVFAVCSQNDLHVDLCPVKPTICGQNGTCEYSKDTKCMKRGQYLAAITIKTGPPMALCCKYKPEVHVQVGDKCNVIKTHAVLTVSTKPTGNNDQWLVKRIEKTQDGYNVTACKVVCDAPATTQPPTQPPTTQPAQQTHDNEPRKRRRCFSGDMIVRTPYGQKRMDQVRVGEEVLVSSIDSKPVYAPIEWFYHKDPEMESEFLNITTESGKYIQLSPNHLIPIVPCNSTFYKKGIYYYTTVRSIFAHRLKVGRCIITLMGNELVYDQIVTVNKEYKQGIYSPITSRGTIIVNDIYASCYSTVENHALLQTVHSTLITARRFMDTIWKKMIGENAMLDEDKGIPLPLQMLLKIAQVILPPKISIQ